MGDGGELRTIYCRDDKNDDRIATRIFFDFQAILLEKEERSVTVKMQSSYKERNNVWKEENAGRLEESGTGREAEI